MDPHTEQLLNSKYPKHISHQKTPLPILNLNCEFQCSCGDLLKVTLVSLLVQPIKFIGINFTVDDDEPKIAN